MKSCSPTRAKLWSDLQTHKNLNDTNINDRIQRLKRWTYVSSGNSYIHSYWTLLNLWPIFNLQICRKSDTQMRYQHLVVLHIEPACLNSTPSGYTHTSAESMLAESYHFKTLLMVLEPLHQEGSNWDILMTYSVAMAYGPYCLLQSGWQPSASFNWCPVQSHWNRKQNKS